jgi:hypothetical protein
MAAFACTCPTGTTPAPPGPVLVVLCPSTLNQVIGIHTPGGVTGVTDTHTWSDRTLVMLVAKPVSQDPIVAVLDTPVALCVQSAQP